MKNYSEKFPELYQFLGGLFHQDWSYVYDWKGNTPNYEGVIRDAKIREHKLYLEKNIIELKIFLNLNLDESEIETIMRKKFKLGIRPEFWNLTHKLWLGRILQILEEPMEETKKHFIPEFIG